MRWIAACLLVVFSSSYLSALAQEDPAALLAPGDPTAPGIQSGEVDAIEAELAKAKDKKSEPAKALTQKKAQSEGLSSLVNIAPFSDVSVIQKRYLPKTGRFQTFGGIMGIVNDPWFTSLGLNLRMGYHFTEFLGMELNYFSMNTTERTAAKDLNTEHNIAPSKLVTVKGYSGLDLVWSPIYGKIGLFNRRIIPFDTYLAAGFGTSKVENGTGGSTVHLGAGQLFAVNKSQGFRWDFSWNIMTAKASGGDNQTFNNISLTLGYSFFFPEASYR